MKKITGLLSKKIQIFDIYRQKFQASYPYTAHGGKCLFKKEDIGATCTGFVNIKKGSEADLQKAVATIGPVSVAIDAGHQSFQVSYIWIKIGDRTVL
jgi:hypothetical protein